MKKVNIKKFFEKKENITEFKQIKVVTADGDYVQLSTGIKAYAIVTVEKEKNRIILVVGKKFHKLKEPVRNAMLAQEFYKEDLGNELSLAADIEKILKRFENESNAGTYPDFTCRFNKNLAAEVQLLEEFPNKCAFNTAVKKTENIYKKSAKPIYATIIKNAKEAKKANKKASKAVEAVEEAAEIAEDTSLTLGEVLAAGAGA